MIFGKTFRKGLFTLPIHPSLELNFKSCHLTIQIFSIYAQTVQKTDRTLHQPMYLGFVLENAVYLITHPYSQQKSKPLVWLWIT